MKWYLPAVLTVALVLIHGTPIPVARNCTPARNLTLSNGMEIMFQGCLQLDPTDIPSKLGHCRVVLNELNTNTPNGNANQFVELSKICDKARGGRHRSPSLNHFRLYLLEGQSRSIVMSCNFNGESLINRPAKSDNWLYVLGRKEVENLNMDFDKCQKVYNDLPVGSDQLYGFVLSYGIERVLNRLNLVKNGNKYEKKLLTPELLQILQRSIQDIVVYGARPVQEKCAIFEELYPEFAKEEVCSNALTLFFCTFCP